jgi:hypothetical protein
MKRSIRKAVCQRPHDFFATLAVVVSISPTVDTVRSTASQPNAQAGQEIFSMQPSR